MGETARLNIDDRDDLGQTPGLDRHLRSKEENMIKRTIFLVILYLGIYNVVAFAQAPLCNDMMIMALKGKWIASHGLRPSGEVSNEQYRQVTNRIDAVHPLLLEAYPELIGMGKGEWSRVGAPSVGREGATGPYAYIYVARLYEYFCAPNASPDSILGKAGAPFKPVYAGDSFHAMLGVHFNHFGDFLRGLAGMTVNGLQVFHRLLRPAGTWKGHDVYRASSDQMEGMVMLTRKGMLPYRPITRKQYLEYMIARMQQLFDDTVAGVKETERKLAAANLPKTPEMEEMLKETKQQAAEQVANTAKYRDDTTAVFQEELKKNAAGNTLDSPAVVAGIGTTRFIDDLGAFTTEEKGGQALVTVNPDYFRKDLPPYVPQFIVVHWSWNTDVATSYFRKMLETNFAIEKLQAMIDR